LIPAALLFDVSGLERAVLIAVAILGLIVELLNSEVSRRKSVGAVTVRFWPLAASYRRQRGEDRGQVKQPFPVAISDQSQQILAAGLSEI